MKLFISICFTICLLSVRAQHIDSVITKTKLQQAVWILSADSLRGRLTGSKGAEQAADYIRNNFKNSLLHPINGLSNYFDSFKVFLNKKITTAVNVVGAVPSATGNDSIVIFCAHYDHIGVGDDLPFNRSHSKKDLIYNGANDNASGVAALFSLAQYYSTLKTNKYTILFIAFSAEELGELGSKYFSENINTGIVKAVINIDMIGRPDYQYSKKYSNKCAVITDNEQLIDQLNNSLKKDSTVSQKDFFIKDNYPWESLFTRSDHYSFYGKVNNILSFMATSPIDEYYHSTKDEYATIDFDFLLLATKQIAIACRSFIE